MPGFAHETGELGANIAIAAYTFFLDISEAESLRYAVSQEFVASAGVLYDTLRNRKQTTHRPRPRGRRMTDYLEGWWDSIYTRPMPS